MNDESSGRAETRKEPKQDHGHQAKAGLEGKAGQVLDQLSLRIQGLGLRVCIPIMVSLTQVNLGF